MDSPANLSSGKLFALCGVDGCGKSTLVDEVSKKLQEQGVFTEVIKKDQKQNVALVDELWVGEKDWSKGKFAQAVSLASVFDFLWHYHNRILPIYASGSVIICDRYSYCYIAYMKSVGAPNEIVTLIEQIIEPVKTFYIRVPADVAISRHHLRGGPSDDEAPEVIRQFAKSYDSLFSTARNIITIDNTQPLEYSTQQIVDEILECM